MPEEVLFGSESRRTSADIATYLRRVADNLKAGENGGDGSDGLKIG